MAQSSGGYAVTFSVVDQATPQLTAIQRQMRQLREPLDRMRRDTQQFINPAGLRKVSDGFADIGRQASTLFSSLSRLLPIMGTLTGAASLAGLAALGRQWASFATQLSRDAENIRGTTPQALQTLQRAMTLAGGSAEQTTQSLKDLTNTAAAAFRGDATAATWFRKAGISLEGFNGQLRPTTELLPEVLNYISDLKDPTDRLTAANGFGSAALRDMVQNLERARQPGETLLQTYSRLNTEAAKFPALTDAQIAAMQRHEQAMASLRVSVDNLGQRVGTYMASAFTPFVEAMDKFAKDPATIKAVDELGAAFVSLGEAMDWETILGFVRDTVREITTMIRLLKEAVQWLKQSKVAQGAGSLITQTRIEPTAEEILAGSPLAAGLPAARRAEILAAAPEAKAPSRPALSDFSIGNAWEWAKGRVGFGGGAAEASRAATAPTAVNDNKPPATGGAGTRLSPEARGLLDTIAGTESGGRDPYTQLYGGKNIALPAGAASPGVPIRSGPNVGKTSSAYGRYQFINPTWFEQSKKLTAQNPELAEEFANRTPLAQDLAAWNKARERYEAAARGRSLQRDLESGQLHPAGQSALASEWTSLPGGIEQTTSGGGFSGRLGANIARQQRVELAMASPENLAQGAPAEVTGGAPVSGSVDVTITHKNPPPGATVTAAGMGDVNVGAPRTEQQSLGNVA